MQPHQADGSDLCGCRSSSGCSFQVWLLGSADPDLDRASGEGKSGLRPPCCSERPRLHGVLTQQPGPALGIDLVIIPCHSTDNEMIWWADGVAHRRLRTDRRLQTAALVGRDGSIDWLSFPRFDSAACFAALLGTLDHGRWVLAPESEIQKVQRRYRPGTLVIETEYYKIAAR